MTKLFSTAEQKNSTDILYRAAEVLGEAMKRTAAGE